MDPDSSYRVELEQFSGPMDLLLHLVREDELEVETIPVARVCDRYVGYLEDLDRIDIDAAGDFLVLASTLMRLKSSALLPGDVDELDEEDLDPRFELVRQLIQYRRFKRVAELLRERREVASRTFDRGMHPESDALVGDGERAPFVPTGASVELLFGTFARLLKETQAASGYVVTRDDTPMEVHIERVQLAIPIGSRAGFAALLPEGFTRAYAIGVLLALLELMKRGRVEVVQPDEFGAIEIEGREPWELSPTDPGAVDDREADQPPPVADEPQP